MFYEFPQLTNIQQVRDAIAWHRAKADPKKLDFFEAVRGDISIFNYQTAFEFSFAPLSEKGLTEEEIGYRKILRECRGLIFNNQTGEIVARRYHKFFNVNERDETAMNLIDVSQPHVILEKLDGSMITPFKVGGNIMWGTKMGATDIATPVALWVAENKQYLDFVETIMADGFTPIFEWCSRKQRIVIDYPVDRLVLTAMRHNTHGFYVPYTHMKVHADRWNIDVVRALSGNVANMQQFLAETKDLKGMEGWVIRFDNGHMYKVKAEEYLLVHKTKDHLTREKDVVRMVVKDQIDDLKPLLSPEDSRALSAFYDEVHTNINKKADELFWITQAAYDNLNGSKKRFKEEVVDFHPAKNERGILFRTWDLLSREGVDVAGVAGQIRDIVANSTGTGPKVDEVRNLFGGAKWDSFYYAFDLDA